MCALTYIYTPACTQHLRILQGYIQGAGAKNIPKYRCMDRWDSVLPLASILPLPGLNFNVDIRSCNKKTHAFTSGKVKVKV